MEKVVNGEGGMEDHVGLHVGLELNEVQLRRIDIVVRLHKLPPNVQGRSCLHAEETVSIIKGAICAVIGLNFWKMVI